MFENYPKQHIELPEKYKNIYLLHYKKNRDGKSIASFFSKRLEGWLHKKAAADRKINENSVTLEIGAGTLNHLPYEHCRQYDIVEPFLELYKESPLLNRIRNIFKKIEDIPLLESYDRIISIATFEHLLNLPEITARACMLLKQDGVVRIAIPNEGTWLWRLSWKLTTGLEFRLKHKLKYSVMMAYEHVNSADEIEEVLNYFFKTKKCSVLGINRNTAFYRFYVCKNPDLDRAKNYLSLIKS
jgi:hypothetical protein